MTPFLAVLFDLDGTLYDSSGILGEAYREALDGILPVPTEAEVLRFVGKPVREIFAGLYPDLADAAREDGARRVLEVLCAKIRAGGGKLLPGAREVLSGLRDRGIRRAIVTNARRPYLDATLAGHGLTDFTAAVRPATGLASSCLVESAVCDGDRPGYGKGSWIVEILSGWEISPLDAAYVGDRGNDLEAAREAGVRFFGVAGHGDAEEVAGADAILSRVDEVLDLL